MRRIDTDFFIRPMEPLFFGEPRPFNAGESHFARSQFPPSPMTFQGMVRSQLLRSVEPPLDLDDWSREKREERAALVGSSDRLPPGWQIKGPLPAVVEYDEDGQKVLHPWSPAPRFLYRRDSGPGFIRGRLLTSNQQAMDDRPDCRNPDGPTAALFGPLPERRKYRTLDGWVDGETLYRALASETDYFPDKGSAAVPPFVKDTEPHPGIALDRQSNTSEDGMLYVLEHLRFARGGGFWGRFSGNMDERFGPKPLCQGVGGAGKKARLVAFEDPPPLKSCWRELLAGKHLAGQNDRKGRYWLYLLTPVRIEPGQRAENGATMLPGGVVLRRGALPPGISIRCTVALTGSPIVLGGMDTARGHSRPNNAYVPPGSAWLIEIETAGNDLLRQTLQRLNDAHPMGDPDEACFGFGHTLVGIEPDGKEHSR
ncbi:MAG: type III-B CRISPR module-associated Cmr3 family protein [Syntrophaceae bacterium]